MHSFSGQLTTETGQNHAFTLWTINHTATYTQSGQNYETDACPQVYLQQNKVHDGWRNRAEHCHP